MNRKHLAAVGAALAVATPVAAVVAATPASASASGWVPTHNSCYAWASIGQTQDGYNDAFAQTGEPAPSACLNVRVRLKYKDNGGNVIETGYAYDSDGLDNPWQAIRRMSGGTAQESWHSVFGGSSWSSDYHLVA